MAITASGWYVATFNAILGVTQLAVDFDAETHRAAMFLNTITPNFGLDTAYGASPYNANEVASGGGYTTGGLLLVGTTITQSPAGTTKWDAEDLAWPTSTISGARGLLAYADALAGNNAILLVNFGQDYSTQGGTFSIQFPGTGVGSVDLTPGS